FASLLLLCLLLSFPTRRSSDLDLNDDGIFDNATELVFDGVSLATNPTTLDTSFPLSPDAMQGTHKMRIGTADSGQSTPDPCYSRSEEHTSELQSRENLVCRLLL